MKQDRRSFLKKALKGAAVVGVTAGTNASASIAPAHQADGNGVVLGHSNKKEILYHKSKVWEKYYKIAY